MISIIEDEKELNSLFRELFLEKVNTFENEEDFFLNIANTQIAVVDLKSDNFEGPSIIRKLNENYPKIKVLVISGYLTKDYKKELKSLKIDGIFSKPFNFQKFQSICENMLSCS